VAKIISVKEFISLLGYPDTEQVTECAGKALEATTLYIEAILRTSLSLKTDNEDMYPLQEYLRVLDKSSRASLHLKNGFVDTTTVVVSTAVDLFSWDSENILSAIAILARHETGLVYLKRSECNIYNYCSYVKVKYTSGFEEDISGVLKNTPEWLKEAAIFIARELYRSDDAELDMDGDLGAMRLLEGHIRDYPLVVKPIS